MAEPKTEVDRRMDRIEERLEKLESAVNNPDLERLLENMGYYS